MAEAPTQSATQTIKLRPEEVQFFNRQLASMARLNMPIAKGLRILAREVENPEFRAMIQSVQQDLDEGLSLPDALAKYPQTFSALQLEVIKAGETTGNLSVILDELNSHTAAMHRIKSRVLEAITYPALISVVMFSFVLFFLIAVAPQFETMLVRRAQAVGTSNQLPLVTRLLFLASGLVQNPLILGTLVTVSVGVAVFGGRKVSRMGEEYDDFLFGLPLFGPLFERAALMKVTRTMRDLLNNGVSMVETLRLTGNTVGKNRIQVKLGQLRGAVEEGGSFSKNLAGGEVFPDTMVWKLQMAEEKGIIEDALAELADEFEVAVDQQTTLITKLLAPLMLVAMGGLVFLMFLACFVPMTNIYS
ncbi:MAG: type II secretion system F family protein [Planctomycetota bacterium]